LRFATILQHEKCFLSIR